MGYVEISNKKFVESFIYLFLFYFKQEESVNLPKLF